MRNKDKDIKQKVSEYMDILGIYVPGDAEGDADQAPDQDRDPAAGRPEDNEG